MSEIPNFRSVREFVIYINHKINLTELLNKSTIILTFKVIIKKVVVKTDS
jgi:hypothetical protein